MKRWLLTALLAWSLSSDAGEIVAKSIDQKWGPLHLIASPQFKITSSDVINEAINSGIVLSLIAKLQSHKNNDFWFDSTLSNLQQTYQVRYFSLSGQYQLHNTLSDERNSFVTLSDLWRHLEQNIQFEIPINQLASVDYLSVRLRLDAGALPSAMQLPVLLSGDWRFKSDWYESQLTQPKTAQRP